MSRNKFGYFIKEGVGSIFTHGFMSFASVCTIVACLVIMGSFSLLALNVSSIIKDLENNNQILAYVDENLTEDQAKALQSQIEAVPNVRSATFVSRDEAMSSFEKQYSSSLFQGMDSSILRDRYVVYLENNDQIEQTQQNLLGVSGVAKVNAHVEISKGFITVRNIVAIVSLLLVTILFIISLFIMSNTIKLATFERREEIAIMKMVGATSSFIRWPFVIEGLILGLMGALIAFILQWGIYALVANRIVGSSGLSFLEFLPFSTFSLEILAAFGVVGLGVGIFGSLMAIKNYLKV